MLDILDSADGENVNQQLRSYFRLFYDQVLNYMN